MNDLQAQPALYLCIVAFLSGLDFFVHDFRVSFSIRERKPEIEVSVSVFPSTSQANGFCGRKNVESVREYKT